MTSLIWILLFILFPLILIRMWCSYKKSLHTKIVIAFFHPGCNDGGGGEAVLWKSIKAIQSEDKKNEFQILIYSNSDKDLPPPQTLTKVKDSFGVVLEREVKFVPVKYTKLVEAKTWPRFTMLGQSLGSVVLGFEALLRECPDILIESKGHSFILPVFYLIAGCSTAAYIHYPTISNDMVENVSQNKISVNNPHAVASNTFKTAKLWYYKFFALLYWITGQFCSVVMVNSTWTKNHIKSLWTLASEKVHLVYPPVDCTGFTKIPLEFKNRGNYIVSIGQFRKEKNHLLQVESFAKFLRISETSDATLVMIGSVRENKKGDEKRVQRLQQRVKELGIENNVIIAKKIPKTELKEWLSKAKVGLHTMTDEHFGIGIVELMAAGVIPIAHNSAGPKEDIVIPFEGKKTGFLASSVDEYAEKMHYIFCHEAEAVQIQKTARQSTWRFSDEIFKSTLLDALADLPQLKHLCQSSKKIT